jgi:hypothetical protein
MDNQVFRLIHAEARSRALEAVRDAPDDFGVEIGPPKRTLLQNAKFHAICHDVAQQATWLGRTLTPLQWKLLFVSGHAVATEIPALIVPGLEGEWVNLRESTAQMKKNRKASLIEYTLAWCAMNDIHLREVAARGFEALNYR